MRAGYLAVVTSALLGLACGLREPGRQDDRALLCLPEGYDAAVEVIGEELLRDHVTMLASDEMEGRLPGSEGDRRARRYLADALREVGFEPAFAGSSWEQALTIVGMTAHMPDTWEIRSEDGRSLALGLGEDYVAVAGRQERETRIDKAPFVFVGYGIQAPEYDWDDFKGVDLTDAILLVLNDDPDWDESLFAGERKLLYGRWDYKYLSAARQRAAGAIIIHTTPSAGYPWSVVRTGSTGEQFELVAGDEPRLGVRAWMTEGAAQRLVALSGHDLDQLRAAARSRDFVPVDLGVTTSLSFASDLEEAETANVAGVLRGTGPDLDREYVIYSAHHDHFGIGEPDQTGDRIYNGALDNGVAMAQALAVARAFAALPARPRRSIMILFVAAEEQGLLGSRFFTTSGVIHPGRITANINFELGNVWGRTRDVTVYGLGKSELDDVLRRAATLQGRVLEGERDVRAGWFYRSDQLSFARIGVPAIWFKSGVDFIGRPPGWGKQVYAAWIENHYHKPSDEVESDWVFDGLAEDARLAFTVGLSVAGCERAPAWRPGDEFEAERLRALSELAQQREP